jgi:hypothetical protein
MNELEKEIRKYKLDSLLLLLAESSRDLYLKHAFMEEVEWKRLVGGFLQIFKQLLPVWGLADLSYIAIQHSNDYRSLSPTNEDIYKLNNIRAGVSNETAKEKIDAISKEDRKTHILFGLSQKQFWYQEIIRGRNIYYNFLRYYILLSEMPKFFPDHKHPNDDLFEITGFDIKSFSQLLIAGWAYNITVSPLLKIEIADDLKKSIPIMTETNLQKCIDVFSADYRYYRKPNFPNNPLFFKPIIKTDTNKLIISNSFIWARKVYEGIYWIIRDKYMRQNSQSFINNFGKYYERYIQEVLAYYLRQEQYEKIETAKNKKADWLIYTENYILVVEQKSCLMTIALKEEYPSLRKLDDYLKNFKEAYLQIAETIKDINEPGKQIIKLILHFEKFYMGEAIIKERVNQLCKTHLADLSNYFFIDTEEFEKLIQILSDDEESFNKIIETKIAYEDNVPILEGKEFHFIINKQSKIKDFRYLDSYAHLFERLFEDIEQ